MALISATMAKKLLVAFIFATCTLGAIPPRKTGKTGNSVTNGGKITLICDFVVVGGGPGGTFTGYELAKRYNSTKRVCLFERESILGGRFLDVPQIDGLRIPMGGLRFYEYGLSGTMKLYTQLANELNITRHADYLTDGVIKGYNYAEARGKVALNQDLQQLVDRYVDPKPSNSTNLSSDIYTGMLNSYNRTGGPQEAAQFSSLSVWVRALFNDESEKFAADTDRYRSDFTDPNDVPSWMEGFIWDSQFDNALRSYPDGGMSSFCRGMGKRIQELNPDNRVFLSQPVVSVASSNSDKKRVGLNYQIETQNYTVYAHTAILAIPGFDYNPYDVTGYTGLSGDIVDAIRDTKYFKAYLPDQVVVVGQQWPERWWEKSNSGFTSGQAFTRAGLNSYAHIFTPATTYEYNANLTRSVYNDDPVQIRKWTEIYRVQGIAGVEREAVRGLQLMYPDLSIPKPTKTLYHHHPAGWSWLYAGSYNNNVTVDTLSDWAVEPVPEKTAKCTLALPTDAWGVRESGWAAGAWSVAIKWLKQCHGIVVPNPFNHCVPFQSPPLNQTWCDCGLNTYIPPEGIAYRRVNCPETLAFDVAPPRVYGPRN